MLHLLDVFQSRDFHVTMSTLSAHVSCIQPYPELPSCPQTLEVADVNKDRVTLKWQEPATDGGADLTEYVVEMKKSKDSQYSVVAQVEPNTPFYTAKSLREGQQYQFRVRAKNLVGTSQEAAELDSPVIAKAKATVGGLGRLISPDPNRPSSLSFIEI